MWKLERTKQSGVVAACENRRPVEEGDQRAEEGKNGKYRGEGVTKGDCSVMCKYVTVKPTLTHNNIAPIKVWGRKRMWKGDTTGTHRSRGGHGKMGAETGRCSHRPRAAGTAGHHQQQLAERARVC